MLIERVRTGPVDKVCIGVLSVNAYKIASLLHAGLRPYARRVNDVDLGALSAELTRRLIVGERPLLAAHGLSMWGYVALSTLLRQPPATQAELATAMRYDKTRLIAVLDELESQGLIQRERDPADRRARIVRLTQAGRRRCEAARRDVRAMEDEMLEGLTSAEQRILRDTLTRLARPWGGR